jgi:hypothetical protein
MTTNQIIFQTQHMKPYLKIENIGHFVDLT